MGGPIDQAFDRFDTDHSGFLELDEVVVALQELVGKKLVVDEELVNTVMEIVDKNGDGKIGIDEFYDMFEQLDVIISRGEANQGWNDIIAAVGSKCGGSVEKVFGLLDTDGTGRVTFSNLRDAVLECGLKLPSKTTVDYWVQNMVFHADRDNDGEVSWEEFQRFAHRQRTSKRIAEAVVAGETAEAVSSPSKSPAKSPSKEPAWDTKTAAVRPVSSSEERRPSVAAERAALDVLMMGETARPLADPSASPSSPLSTREERIDSEVGPLPVQTDTERAAIPDDSSYGSAEPEDQGSPSHRAVAEQRYPAGIRKNSGDERRDSPTLYSLPSVTSQPAEMPEGLRWLHGIFLKYTRDGKTMNRVQVHRACTRIFQVDDTIFSDVVDPFFEKKNAVFTWKEFQICFIQIDRALEKRRSLPGGQAAQGVAQPVASTRQSKSCAVM